MIRPVRRWVVLIASAGLAALSLPAVATTAVLAVSQQAGPFWPGNLLSMDNADFENGVGDWSAVSGANPLTTDSTAYLHNSALKIVTTGSSPVLRLSGREITVNPDGKGDMYRVGAYVQMPANGQATYTTEFDLACYGTNGTLLRWDNGNQVPNNNTGNWQWVEDDITLQSDCVTVQGSPRAKFTGLNSGDTIHMDEVWFAPYRAALMIGAVDTNETTWQSDNTNIGPLQSDKVFWTNSQDFQTWSTDPHNICYAIEQEYTNHSQWPVCLIAFKKQETEMQIQGFLAAMPSDQTVIFIYHQEPEGDTFGPGPCIQNATGATEFICEFEQETSNIAAAAFHWGRTENVFTAEDSASGKYVNGGPGADCSWIVPPSYSDFYLADHYERGWANGSNLHVQDGSTGAQEWNNWLGCVNTLAKPIGLAEYGLCSDSNSCQPAPSCPGASTALDEQTMFADNDYLKTEPSGTSPTLLWEYWYENCWQFDDSNGGITEWKAIENKNGGAVGG